MLFLFTIITLFICSSSYADNYIPQPRLEDSELRFLSNLPKPVFKLIAKLHSLKALGEKYEDGIEVGVEIVKGIYEQAGLDLGVAQSTVANQKKIAFSSLIVVLYVVGAFGRFFEAIAIEEIVEDQKQVVETVA
ncbi:hypothetical protein E3N88_28190 [Mikania micrantha]|uniref:Uncharacterized protein n=1 Tax=Mikania micrantha TaxID=192012 RepID=A0A5N6MYS2_9ASTR|nr:hypothetical protein E3N88_28190 [Mikania micrantha]